VLVLVLVAIIGGAYLFLPWYCHLPAQL
jgi:hypothetical protein